MRNTTSNQVIGSLLVSLQKAGFTIEGYRADGADYVTFIGTDRDVRVVAKELIRDNPDGYLTVRQHGAGFTLRIDGPVPFIKVRVIESSITTSLEATVDGFTVMWANPARPNREGGFVQALAAAYAVADSNNKLRIRNAFPEIWALRPGLTANTENTTEP